MKKIFVSIVIALMGGLLTVPGVDAQNSARGGRNAAATGQSVSGQRPGRGNGSAVATPSKPSGNVRPGQGAASGGSAVRPGASNSTPPTNNVRPGAGSQKPSAPATPTRPSTPARPSAPAKPSAPSKPVAPSRPSTTVRPVVPARPSTPSRPAQTMRPTRPGAYRPSVAPPPTRPGRPSYGYTWTRPVPPSGWRPTYRRPIVPNILGMTLGLTINSALDYLYNGGYSVDGYGSQEVYLRNVTEMNYSWPDATLYFSDGGLVRSEFYYSTTGYNTTRYNNVYSSLCNSYGAPVSSGNNTATWFGYNGDYITLQYTMLSTSSGYRYFTILTYGN